MWSVLVVGGVNVICGNGEIICMCCGVFIVDFVDKIEMLIGYMV